MKASLAQLMRPASRYGFRRRNFLRMAGALPGVFWADETLQAMTQSVRTASRPSDLKITDLRVAVVAKAPNSCPIIRIDTNQGISGLGEVRDGASKSYALMLKSRILGENPCDIDKVFRKIKQFGHHSRQGGGVSGVEMALWDLAGKAYNVPVYRMLGGSFRDRIRCYADTPMSPDPKVYAKRMKARLDKGFTFLKMDLGIPLIENVRGALTRPTGVTTGNTFHTQHMFTGMEITPKGIGLLSDYVAEVRAIVGMEVPLAADHFGHIGLNSCIRLGRALERYNIAWLEDLIPWQHTALWQQITNAIDVPTLTGEDIYLKTPFEELCRTHAVDMIQPDLATSGGILETKKIGDMAQEYGVPMVLHFAGTPVSCMANVHCAAATENFLCLEYHSADIPWWDDLVTGIDKPIVNRGFIQVPDRPGLGIVLNDEAVKQHLLDGSYFAPTSEWDKESSHDRLWS